MQQKRYRGRKGVHCNADMGTKELEAYVRLDDEAQQLLKMAMTDLHLSARAYDRILKVSRTIADLDAADGVGSHHVAEAIQYRTLDRQLWE